MFARSPDTMPGRLTGVRMSLRIAACHGGRGVHSLRLTQPMRVRTFTHGSHLNLPQSDAAIYKTQTRVILRILGAQRDKSSHQYGFSLGHHQVLCYYCNSQLFPNGTAKDLMLTSRPRLNRSPRCIVPPCQCTLIHTYCHITRDILTCRFHSTPLADK